MGSRGLAIGFLALCTLGTGALLSAQGIKLNASLAHPIGGDVERFLLVPDGTRAVYVADERSDGVRELFAAPTDGSRASQRLNADLAPGSEVQEFNLRLSPGGERVLFQVGNGMGQSELWSAPVDGSAPAVLLSERSTSFTFAPDGATVLLASDRSVPGVIALYRVPADGSEQPVRLSNPGTGDVRTYSQEPCTFSPDGTRVVYVADHNVTGRTELFSVPLDGSQPVVRLNTAPVSGGAVQGSITFAPLRVSPDGTRVVYRADQTVDERYELFSAPIDGSSPALRISGTTIAQGDVQGGTFAPSSAEVPDFRIAPDSTRVVFRADRVADGVFALFVAPIDGSTPPVALTPAGAGARSALEYSISPDSSRIVYLSDSNAPETFELFVVPLEGGSPRRLSAPMVASGDVTGAFAPSFRISPDARWVVYRADQELDEQFELFRVPLDGRRFVRRSDQGQPPLVSVKLNPPILGPVDVGDFELDSTGTRVVLEVDRTLVEVPLASAGPARRLDRAERPVEFGTFQLAADAPWVAYLGNEARNVSELFAALGSATNVVVNGALPLGPVLGDVADFAFDPDGTHLVYRADGDEDEIVELYATRTTGRAPVRRLNQTLGLGSVDLFRIHPSGLEVLYLAQHADRDGPAPFAVPIEGGTPRLVGAPLPAGSQVTRLDLTADGSRAVFVASPDLFTLGGLYSAPFDGSAPRIELSRVGGQSQFVERFHLSPTSDRVAFVSPLLFGPVKTLHTVPIDHASDPVQLTSAGLVVQVAFSPDGQFLVYGLQEGTLSSLFSVRADGSEPAVRLGGPTHNGFVLELHFAPDSSRLVWLEGLGSFRQLYSAPLDGSAAAVVIAATDTFGGAVLASPQISADSTRVLYLHGPSSSLHARALDVGAPAVLLSGSGNLVPAFALSPDGTTAAYWGDAPGLGRRVLRVPVDGSASAVPLSSAFGAFTYGQIRFAPGGELVLFTAESSPSGPVGPYAVPVDGSTAERLLARIPAGGALSSSFPDPNFEASPDARKLVYRAALDELTQVNELFLSLLERAPLPADPPGD